MAEIKLWYSPGACSLASHILLLETGLPFDAIKLDVHAGFPASFRTLNPKLRVPVLSLDGQIITETPAILTAIAQLAPDKHLLGSSDLELVRAYEWLAWLSGTLHGQAFGGLFRAHRFSDDPGTYEAIRRKAKETVGECFGVIERDLPAATGGVDHAVGKGFTAVDAFLYVFWRWGMSLGMGMEEAYPRFTALVVELVKRRAVREALEREGVESYVSRL